MRLRIITEPLGPPPFQKVSAVIETPEELRALVRATGSYSTSERPVADAAFECWKKLRNEMDRQKILI